MRSALVFSLALLPLLAYAQEEEGAKSSGGNDKPKGKNRRYNLRLAHTEVAPDGYKKQAATMNGQTPGPLLKGNKGDTFFVNIRNDLSNTSMWRSHSMHWHGIHMNRQEWADGVAAVTQCPQIPGESFEYEVPTAKQAGTFWYHSHYSTQYCEGVRGPLIIYDPNDPHKNLYDIDNDDTVISLSDWFHQTAKQFHHKVWKLNVPRSNATLINGQGVAHQMNGTSGSPAIINVQKGKRYRFRLINMACDIHYWWSVDGHDMTIIEADSIETKPIKADSVMIMAGQRYSFVLNANQPVDNYWVRAKPFKSRSLDFENGANTAILHYKGATTMRPASDPNVNVPVTTNLLNEGHLVPLKKNPVPGKHELGKADINYLWKPAFNIAGETLFWINNHTLDETAIPTLLQILSGARDPADLMPKELLYVLPPQKTVEITIIGSKYMESGPHPFHLHGHDFWVVKSADSETPNFENPIVRDTVNAGFENQSVSIRFRTDNPGPWMLHCHIDWHLERGLGAIFVEDTYGVGSNFKQDPPSRDWNNLCPEYDAWKKAGNED